MNPSYLPNSLKLSLLGTLLLAAMPGWSIVNHYTDRDTFIAVTAAASATGTLPNSGPVSSPSTLGSVTVALASGATQLHVGGLAQQSPRISGAEISVIGTMNLNLQFPTPVQAVGFDFAEPATDPLGVGQTFSESTFEATLKDGATRVGRFQFNAPNDTAWFLGLVSTRVFNSLELREIIGGPDNEFIGEIFTSSTPGTVILPESGGNEAAFAAFDASLIAYLEESCFPGISAAATYDGRLVYRRSYGWSDYLHTAPLHYSSPMGIGSCSKPLTVTVVRNLIRAGQLLGTQKIVDLLGITPPSGMVWSAGFADITVDHLIAQTSGIQRYKPDANDVGNILGLGRPATFAEVLSWYGTQPLLFLPGAGNSYSNFGYGVLGAIVEVVTGQRYEKVTTETMAAPLGAYTIRGSSEEPYTTPVPPGVLAATMYLNNDAAGGMRASAPDYCRFMRAYRMTGVPKASATPGGTFFYTFYGSVDDVYAVARQRQTGGHALEWVVFTNDRGYQSAGYLDTSTAASLLAISSFPTHDYFPYLNWKMGWFWNSGLGRFNAGAGDTEDVDKDGLVTAIEYAYGTLPRTSNAVPPGLVTLPNADSGSTVEFRRTAARLDVAYELEYSEDLQSVAWETIVRSTEGQPAVPLDPSRWTVTEVPVGGDHRVVVGDLSAPSPGKGFFRIRIVPQ